jgi:hypothetical protein
MFAHFQSFRCFAADNDRRTQTFGSVLIQVGDTSEGQIHLGLPRRDARQTLTFTP